MKLVPLICFTVLLNQFTAHGAGTCDNTQTYLQTISQESSGLAYSDPTTINNKCRLDQTCCTSTAESSLITNVNNIYEKRLYNKLNSTIRECLNQPLQISAGEFVDASKANTLSSLSYITQGQFTIDETIIDRFYNYLKNGILNMNLSKLQVEFQTLHFKIFLISFREGLKSSYSSEIVTSNAFETCLYGIFNKHYRDSMTTDYNRLETRLNLYLRYLYALKTSDQVLEAILSHTLSSDCKESLIRMDHCSHCSANQVDTTTVACYSFCLNSLQGCFVDLEEFGNAYANHVDELEIAKNKLLQFNPFESINLVISGVSTIVFNTFASLLPAIKSEADSMCNTEYTTRKRSIPEPYHQLSIVDVVHHVRSKRQNAQVPLMYITDSVTCSINVKSILQNLSEELCQQSESVSINDYSCWNGTHIDSYLWEVPSKTRLQQQSNPELNIRANTGLLYKSAIGKLNIVSSDLSNCQSNPRTCTIMLSGLMIPSGDDYDFGNLAQFQEFTELGFPDPVTVSVIPVPPSTSTVSSTTQMVATTTTSLVTTTSTTSLVTTTTTSTTLSTQTTSTTSTTAIIRPSSSSSTSSSSSRSVTVATFNTPTNTPIDHVPDPDKPKDERRGSGHTLSASLIMVTSLILMITFIIIN